MKRLAALAMAALAPITVAMTPGHAAPSRCSGALVEAGGFYVVVESSDSNPLDLWIYQESNGIPGLQRGGSSNISNYSDEQCQQFDSDGQPLPPDTLVF